MLLIDRMLLRNFLKAWLVCFVSLLSLYIVIDIFNKLDDFFDAAKRTETSLVEVMGAFYAYQLVLIFDRLCGVMVLLAAMFTVTWMLRNNELLPLLSAGVPTRRVLRPVVIGACAMLSLSIANRELLMPRVSEQLQNPASDPRGEGVLLVTGAYEPNGILIAGQTAYRQDLRVKNFSCTLPERIASSVYNITAEEAYYIPRPNRRGSRDAGAAGLEVEADRSAANAPQQEQLAGGWLLTGTTPATLPPTMKENVLHYLDPGKLFLRTERVDFDAVTRSNVWYQYASTWSIIRELNHADGSRLAGMAVQVHLRFTLPVLTLLMVLMGVATILRDQCRNVFLNAGMCLIVAALFYAACYLARYLGEHEYLSPTLAAWLPVLLFGPPAVAMADAIHT